jgi:hypothetical protein
MMHSTLTSTTLKKNLSVVCEMEVAMYQSEHMSKMAPDLVKAQAGITGVARDGNNPIFRSKYITLDGILLAVRPVLSQCNIFLTQSVGDYSTAEGVITSVTVRSTLLHSSGEWIANEVTVPVNPAVDRNGKVQAVDAHRIGSSITYGRRYSLSALLGIGEDDDDGNVSSGYEPQPMQKPAPVSQPKPQPAPKPEAPALKPVDAFNAEVDRLYGKETSKADRKGIHNAIVGGGKEVSITPASLLHATQCLAECKTQKEADEFITGCMEVSE